MTLRVRCHCGDSLCCSELLEAGGSASQGEEHDGSLEMGKLYVFCTVYCDTIM